MAKGGSKPRSVSAEVLIERSRELHELELEELEFLLRTDTDWFKAVIELYKVKDLAALKNMAMDLKRTRTDNFGGAAVVMTNNTAFYEDESISSLLESDEVLSGLSLNKDSPDEVRLAYRLRKTLVLGACLIMVLGISEPLEKQELVDLTEDLQASA